MRLALYLVNAAAVGLAWTIARRRAEHRPVAWALSVGLAAEIGRAVLLAWALPAKPDPAKQLEGALRLAVYADRALFVAWPFAVAAVALVVLAQRRAWPAVLGYAAAVAVLIGGYPTLRFGALRKAYLAIELAALALGVASFATWYARGYRRARAARAAGGSTPFVLDLTGRTAAALVAGHFAMVVLGPYRFSLFGEDWAYAQIAYLAILGAVVLLQLGGVLFNDRP